MTTRLARSRCAAWFGALAVAAAVPCALAAYLESDAGREGSPQPPPERVVPPWPRPENPVVRLLQRVEVGEPQSYGGLTVFPLLDRGRPGGSGIRTLDEALAREWLDLREQDEARVGSVSVRNRASRPVLLMGGEILLGGRQNRIVREDVLLRPDSGWVSVPVYCGEQERWAGPEPVFKSGGTLVDPALRRMGALGESQDGVWSEIRGRLGEAGAAAPTRSYQQVYEHDRVRARLDDYVAGMRRFREPRAVGLAVACGPRLLGCDLFADPELLERLWDKICRSYAVEPVLRPPMPPGRGDRGWLPGPGRESVRAFLDAAARARFDEAGTPGDGRRLSASGPAEGAALVWRDEVVHAALFTGPGPMPMPMEPRMQE